MLLCLVTGCHIVADGDSMLLPPGRQYQEGQAVYPDQGSQQTGVFPDGTPLSRGQGRRNRYVFVWKAMGKEFSVHV